MNRIWTPTPMATRRFPLLMSTISYPTVSGKRRTCRSEELGGSIDIPCRDIDLIDSPVHHAIRHLGQRMDDMLQARDYVADIDDWAIDVCIRAHVKGWPRIPGLTVENPMPGDAS